MASGIADNDDMVMLGLGGRREDVEEEGDTEMELTEVRLALGLAARLGISGRPFSTRLAGTLVGRRIDPAREAT